MKLGYVGLGKMGINMVLQMQEGGFEVVTFNRSEKGRIDAKRKGVKVVTDSLEEMISGLRTPRLVWLMVSHDGVDQVFKQLLPLLQKGDTIIDGGNCFYKDTLRRATMLRQKGIKFLDAGVSGGPSGARHGACIMVGGDKPVFKKYERLFKALSVPDGYLYAGSHGAGHFVKMVHNGIEYGMMQAMAEGFEILKKSKFKLPLEKVARLYNHKSVIESRLVAWLENAYKAYGEDLKNISGTVAHTGEGEWTVKTAKTLGVPAPIISSSFLFRVKSKKTPSYSGKVLSALRNQFGGHSIK